MRASVNNTQTNPQQIQHLVDALMRRTGRPRADVEQWVTSAAKTLRGGISFYNVSRVAGSFIAQKVRQATPFMVRFGRSFLQNYADQNPALQAEPAVSRQSRNQRTRRRLRQDRSANLARSGHNPWLAPHVLQKEPIRMCAYRNPHK